VYAGVVKSVYPLTYKGASSGGKARKGKQLSEEHKKKIADSIKRKYNTKNNAPVA